jgi:hypothetical protein
MHPANALLAAALAIPAIAYAAGAVEKKRDAGRVFVRGPSVTPGGALIAWLEQEAGERPVRLPLVLKKGVAGYSLRDARIGTAADTVEVDASDSALGIGLADRAATHCKDRSACAFWVEARWRGKQESRFQIDVMRVSAPIEPAALAAPLHAEVEDRVVSDQGFPVPASARKNSALGGATSVAPGKNYTLTVYDIDAGIDTMTAFYESHLRAAKRVSESQEVRFTTQGGTVRLARLDKGTRITLVVGPR